MDTVQDLRSRYGRLSDDALLALLADDSDSLTNEAFQALTDEVVRRGLRKAPPIEAVGVSGPRVYPKASLAARFGAYVIDLAIGMGPAIVSGVVFAILTFANRNGDPSVPGAILFVASLLWALYYGLTKDARGVGQSIGKRATNLMVVNTSTNRPCSLRESMFRNLILGALNLVPGVGWFIEPIVAIVEHSGRRIGDMAANTQVIEVRSYTSTS